MSKRIVISQPRFMPALNYLHRMMVADVFVYLDVVQYTPRDWENRNKIKGPNGVSWLTVPVQRDSRAQTIQDTRISDGENWLSKHLRALEFNYQRAPFFNEHFDEIRSIYVKNFDHLIDLNSDLTDYACRYLEIECDFVRASELAVAGSGEHLLINLCQALNGDTYISGSLGRNYIQAQNWRDASIGLLYHDFQYPQYPQLHGEFMPWTAFVDLFMNCGPNSREILRKTPSNQFLNRT